MAKPSISLAVPQLRAILVGMWNKRDAQSQSYEQALEYLGELQLLCHTIGADPVKVILQPISKALAATYLGTGKVAEIAEEVAYHKADWVVFDDELTPTQVRNLEKAFDCRVLDRAGLILEIFSQHARTAQARAQVELARLQYLLPRLTRMWGHLTRERGGIGLKGAGEQEIETDRRIIRERISKLKDELKKIEKQTLTRRKHRTETVRVALVGYTNAGKSTVMNLLSHSEVLVENKLFATLDTTVRKVVLESVPFLLSDTVGFIRKLPHFLIESFKSTLDEVREADILLHVVDIASVNYLEQIKIVQTTLDEMKVIDRPMLMVFNKVDKLEDDDSGDALAELEHTWLHRAHHPAVFISAATRQNVETLRSMLVQLVIDAYEKKYPGMRYLNGYGNGLPETIEADENEPQVQPELI